MRNIFRFKQYSRVLFSSERSESYQTWQNTKLGKMRSSFILSTILLCLMTSRVSSVCVGTSKNFTSMTDASILANPEKGFYHGFEIYFSKYQPVDLATLRQWWSNENISLVLLEFVMDTAVTSNISSTVLDKIKTDFSTLRSSGLKAIVRFVYTLTAGDMNDAALPQLLKHIDQLKPILQANSDVIAVVQAGLVGTWGEWYYSKNYATKTNNGYEPTAAQLVNRATIINALIKTVKSDRMVQLRTPTIKQNICGTANLPRGQSFNSSNMCSRLGIHNDCFMANGQDQGTFKNVTQRTWLTNEGRFVMVGGESCESNNNTGCSGGVEQIKLQRITFLSTEYHGTVIKGWKSAGCYNKIANAMGYRFELITGTFPSSVSKGGNYCATINIKNSGMAPLYNARPVQVILRNKQNNIMSTFPQKIDPRLWAPGVTASVDLTFTVPTTQATGTYDVILNLPDAYSSLNNPNYRILLANANGVQEAMTRYNILGQVTVQ